MRIFHFRSNLVTVLAVASIALSIQAREDNSQESTFGFLDINLFKVPVSAQGIQLHYLTGIGIEMQIPTETKGPHINFYQEFNTSQSDTLTIIATNLPNQVLSIYWSGSSCSSISTDCKLLVKPSQTVGVWIAKMNEHQLWRDKIKQLRIDFSESDGLPFILRSIQITSNKSSEKTDENTINIPKKAIKSQSVTDDKTHTIYSNMFKLDMKEVFKIKREKFGGGLGSTQSELVLITGDGQLRILNLNSSEIIEPLIAVPSNNEEHALETALTLKPDLFSDLAVSNIHKFLRYDDVLVFEGTQYRHLILSYSHYDPSNSCFSHKLSRLSIPRSIPITKMEATLDQWDLLFSSKPCLAFKEQGHTFGGHQSGGRIDVLNKEKGDIVLALGDYTFDRLGGVPNYPQDLNVDYGKVFKINIHSKSIELLSIGHRNPQGITVDNEGRIWVVEHGPQGGDELNLIDKGLNFGWPNVTLGIQYGTAPWPFNQYQGRHRNYDSPTFAWVPSIGVSNIDQIINFHPFWDGDLVVFSLKGSIYRLRLNGDRVMFSEKIEVPTQERVRYGFTHAPSKSLYIWTDNGKLYEITPSEQAWTLVKRSQANFKTFKAGKVRTISTSEKLLSGCIECHSGGVTAPPDLAGILGMKIAGGEYVGYSDALKGISGVWAEENLKAFIMNPQGYASGTYMPDPQVSSSLVADEIIDALKNLGNNH